MWDAGHHAEWVARIDCSRPESVFILHCILLNMVAYVGKELAAARAAFGDFELVLDKIPYARTWGKTVKRSGKSGGGTPGAHKAASSSLPEDGMPRAVRWAVYASDERELRLVDGMARVQRVPEGERVLYFDNETGGYRFQAVCVSVAVG